jgi:hypothetical protein
MKDYRNPVILALEWRKATQADHQAVRAKATEGAYDHPEWNAEFRGA